MSSESMRFLFNAFFEDRNFCRLFTLGKFPLWASAKELLLFTTGCAWSSAPPPEVEAAAGPQEPEVIKEKKEEPKAEGTAEKPKAEKAEAKEGK